MKTIAVTLCSVVGLIVAAILLMATLIGAYAGVVLGVWFAFTLLMAGIATVMLAGALVQKWIAKKELALSWKTVLWGILLLAILATIPFIGWLGMTTLYLTAFGALLRTARHRVEL